MMLSESYKNRIRELAGILNEDFKSQKAKFMSQGFEEEIVDRYINDFKEIRDKKYREAKDKELSGLNVPTGNARFDIDSYKTFRELEILVDYVAGQRKVGSANFEDIKVDGKPIFENNDVEIYYADTPRACIQYKGNKPYGWCVARSDASNMFYNYRLQQHEPAFYFVKRKAATNEEFSFWNLAKDVFTGKFKDKYHFFVIQVLKGSNISDEKKQSYIVTSAMNDGDKPMSWNDILTFAPELNGLQQIFEPKSLSPQEREKIDKYRKGLSDEEFAKLPYKEKDFYMSVYVKMDKPLSYVQFEELPEDLKNKYVGFGVGLSNKQFESIKSNSKLVKRYAEISNRKFDEFLKIVKDKEFQQDDEEDEEDEEEDIKIKFFDSEILFIDNNKFKNLTNLSVYYLFKSASDKDQIANIILKNKGDNLTESNVYHLLDFATDKDQMANNILNYERDKLSDDDIQYLLKFSIDKDQIVNRILKYRQKNLSNINVFHMLKYAMDKNQVADIIGKENLKNLSDHHVYLLLHTVTDKKQMANIILKYKHDNLTDDNVLNLIQNSQDKDQIANIILKYKGNNLTDDNVFNLLYYSKDKDQIANIILKYKGNNLTDNNVSNLLTYSKDKFEIINNILKYKGDNLTKKNLYNLIKFANNKDQIANIFGKENINELSDENIFELLKSATNIEQMANILGKENINKLSDNSIYHLLKNTFGSDYDKEEMANIILKYKGDNLTDSNVDDLLKSAKDKDKMANFILKYKDDNLTNNNVLNLLIYAIDKDKITNILGKENINKLSDNNISHLIKYAEVYSFDNRNQIKNLLSKYISKEKINDIIQRNEIKTKLIPESHSFKIIRTKIRQVIKENYK